MSWSVCLYDKCQDSLGTSFINLTYFKFAYGDENPLKFVKSIKHCDHGCRISNFDLTKLPFIVCNYINAPDAAFFPLAL